MSARRNAAHALKRTPLPSRHEGTPRTTDPPARCSRCGRSVERDRQRQERARIVCRETEGCKA